MTGLTIWTVYDHPKDYPNNYVARRFENDIPQHEFMVCPDLETIRLLMVCKGLTRIPRQEGDDPVIVEVWL
jgi:hypothetical protein